MPTRRVFLKTSAATFGSGMAYWSGSAAVAADATSVSPNEQPVIGFVGTGIRYHTALGRGATKYGPCAAVCDVDLVQAGRAMQVAVDQHRKFERPIDIDMVEDYRRLLDRKDIDVVVVATTDHWHTKIVIEAMQAGKDVYCEKPLTLTIREGQQIEQVMKRTGRVVQVGTQQRVEFDGRLAKAVALVHHKRVGDVKRLTVCLGGARQCEPMSVVSVPRQLNWEKWLGQAPLVDYREGPLVDREGWGAGFPFSRTHRYYRWWYEYSGGKLTDWGAHHVDIAMWALNKLHDDIGLVTIDPVEVTHPVPFQAGYPTQNDQFNTATSFKVRVTFADGIEMIVRDTAQDDMGFDNGIMFEGSKGRFLVNRGKLVGKPVEELETNPLPDDAMEKLYGGTVPKSQMDNFIECVKTRGKPLSDVHSHNRMLNICHGINIAMRLGRKLTYDPKRQTFVDDAQANNFIEREQRKGYEIVV
jgi:predicted dehydrogenase